MPIEPEQATKDILEFCALLRGGGPRPYAYVILLGLKTFDPVKLLKVVEHGLAFSALERFQRNLALSTAQITALVQIPQRTLTRRRQQGRLAPDESDRLLRASRLFGKALDLFEGDTPAARRWLLSPQPSLGGHVPLDIAKTEVGAREVETLIDRLEHGVYS